LSSHRGSGHRPQPTRESGSVSITSCRSRSDPPDVGSEGSFSRAAAGRTEPSRAARPERSVEDTARHAAQGRTAAGRSTIRPATPCRRRPGAPEAGDAIRCVTTPAIPIRTGHGEAPRSTSTSPPSRPTPDRPSTERPSCQPTRGTAYGLDRRPAPSMHGRHESSERSRRDSRSQDLVALARRTCPPTEGRGQVPGDVLRMGRGGVLTRSRADARRQIAAAVEREWLRHSPPADRTRRTSFVGISSFRGKGRSPGLAP